MVGSGSAAHAAAVEERRKKLQEYLAAKGKLKCPNTKSYVKDQTQCSKPPTSSSTTRPKNDPVQWTKSRAAGRPIDNVLQPESSKVVGTQRPKPASPKILRKGPIPGSLSSRPDYKLCGNTHIQHQQKTASSTGNNLSRKSVTSSGALCMRKPTEQKPTTNHRRTRWMDSVPELHAEKQLLNDFSKEADKENQPFLTTVKLNRKAETGFCNTAKSESNSDNAGRSSMGPKQAVDKGAKNGILLKDQVNKPLVHKIQVWIPMEKSQQQLPTGANCERAGNKNRRTVPSHLVQNLARTRESKKLVTKKENGKVKEDEKEGQNGTKLEENAVIKQTIERTLPRTNPTVSQVGRFNRGDDAKQDLKLMQPCAKRQPTVTAPPSRTTTRHTHLMGGTSKGHIHRPAKNQGCYNSKKGPQILDSKTKRTVPWNCSLRDLNPRAQPCVNRTKPTTSEGGMQKPALLEASCPQVKPDTQRKKGEEDRRKQLEEWLASKGKTYKRPPMKFLAQNKNVQKFNLCFWNSIKEEEEAKKAEMDLSNRIKSTLAECLKLVEQGVHSDEILPLLSGFPEAEKFATFWICKAKLQARTDSSDVMGLYEAAVRCGAEPIQELRDVVLSILKNAEKKTEGIISEMNCTSAKEMAKEEMSQESYFLTPRERAPTGATPQVSKKHENSSHLVPHIKLQITPLPRTPGMPEKQVVKLVTPVRRSVRIEHARPNYPDMIQEHNTVVASLDQLPRTTEADCFIYCWNEALPEESELQIFGEP